MVLYITHHNITDQLFTYSHILPPNRSLFQFFLFNTLSFQTRTEEPVAGAVQLFQSRDHGGDLCSYERFGLPGSIGKFGHTSLSTKQCIGHMFHTNKSQQESICSDHITAELYIDLSIVITN